MKDFYIIDAASFEGQALTTYFLLTSISARDGKNGKQYLALTLADKSGQFDGRMWDDFADALDSCKEGCYIKVQGKLDKYMNKFQFVVSKMRLAADSEISTADFVPTTQYDIASMTEELRGYVERFENTHLKALVFAFLDDPEIGPAFFAAPAAKRLHHAWIGGLLEHVLHLVRVCLATAPFYPEVDQELLVTGAILHDIGKIRELSWKSSFNYTLEGQLIGHISIAQGMLRDKITQLNAAALSGSDAASASTSDGTGASASAGVGASTSTGISSGLQPTESVLFAEGASAPEPFPEKLRILIEHMILSHHGKLEFGSPKLPMTPEAMLLSALDDLEAKFQGLRNEFAAAKTAGKGSDEVTDWVRSMDRPLFDSQSWLTDKK